MSKVSDLQDAGEKQVDDAAIKAALKHDVPMQRVALYLGKLPDCLLALSTKKCMQGTKLGNQTNAAMGLEFLECSVRSL